MYVYEEIINGKKLTEIINETHENVKYLPGHKLPPNVVSIYLYEYCIYYVLPQNKIIFYDKIKLIIILHTSYHLLYLIFKNTYNFFIIIFSNITNITWNNKIKFNY